MDLPSLENLGPDAEKSAVLKSVTKDLVSYFLSQGITNYTAPVHIDWVSADDSASRNSVILLGNGTDSSNILDTGQDSVGKGFVEGMGENEGLYHWLVFWFHGMTKVGEWTQDNFLIFVISLVLIVLLFCLPGVAAQLLSNILYRRYQTKKLQRLINEEEANYQHINTKSNNNVRTLSYKSHGTEDTSVGSGGGKNDSVKIGKTERFVKFRRKSSENDGIGGTDGKLDADSGSLGKIHPEKFNSLKMPPGDTPEAAPIESLSCAKQNAENKAKFFKSSKKKAVFQHSAAVSAKVSGKKKKFTKKQRDGTSKSSKSVEKSTIKPSKSLPIKIVPEMVKQTLQGRNSLNQSTMEQLNLDFYNMQKPKPLITSSNSMTSSTSCAGATGSSSDDNTKQTNTSGGGEKAENSKIHHESKEAEAVLTRRCSEPSNAQPTPNTIRKDILNQLLNGLDHPPLGIVPNAPNNIKDLLKINEQNIPMYSRNSTSISINSINSSDDGTNLSGGPSSDQPIGIKTLSSLKLPDQQYWGKNVIQRYNNDSGFENGKIRKTTSKKRKPVAYDDSFLVYDARRKFKRDHESPIYREKTPESLYGNLDRNYSFNRNPSFDHKSSFNANSNFGDSVIQKSRNCSLTRQTSRSMVDLSFEATLTYNSGAQLIHKNSRADSALYSRDEATSGSGSAAVGDLHFSNASYNIDEFFREDREEQIYENLASILRKTRQLSEAKQREKDKLFGITQI